jgi:hypothetical protein
MLGEAKAAAGRYGGGGNIDAEVRVDVVVVVVVVVTDAEVRADVVAVADAKWLWRKMLPLLSALLLLPFSILSSSLQAAVLAEKKSYQRPPAACYRSR